MPIFYPKAGGTIFNAFLAEFVACDTYHKSVESTIKLLPFIHRQREAEEGVYDNKELVHTGTLPMDAPTGLNFSEALKKSPTDVNEGLRLEALTFDPKEANENHMP